MSADQNIDRHRQLALDTAEHIIKMMRGGEAENNCLSEGADVILEAFEAMKSAESASVPE